MFILDLVLDRSRKRGVGKFIISAIESKDMDRLIKLSNILNVEQNDLENIIEENTE